MAAGSVVKTGATTFEVTRTNTIPNGATVTATIPLTLKHARNGVTQIQREIARLNAMITTLQAKITDIDDEIVAAIEQGVEEEA
jgi:peptidoglycan hydrolase CwlO-like protein